jgi:hypothetical protein
MAQDTGKHRKNLHDQFYTKESKAKLCVDVLLQHVPESLEWLWVEPSAGKGAFLLSVPSSVSKVGIDIDPKHASIHQADFLQWAPPSNSKIVVFGNPPFGRQSSLAKAFIKKAATFADCIAFILPRSFKKPSMNRAFPPNFHLIYTMEMESKSFEVNGDDYSVPCVFQIWQKKDTERVIEKPASEEPYHFTYKKVTDTYHLAIRRVGGKAGTAFLPPGTFNAQTHYYISLQEPQHATEIRDNFNKHNFPSNTTGPRSLSKSEITRVLNQVVRSFVVDGMTQVLLG